MTDASIKPLKMMVLISDRKAGRHISEYVNESGCHFHSMVLGEGTAPDNIAALLGLGETEKSVLVLLLSEDKCAGIIEGLQQKFGFGKGGGMLFTVPIGSICSRFAVEFINDSNGTDEPQKEKSK